MPNAFKFIFLFLGSYLFLQLFYTVYLDFYNPEIDPASLYTTKVLTWFFVDADFREIGGEAKVQFLLDNKPVVNIKEACNGISVAMSLLAFLIAFKGKLKDYLWVVPVSLLVLFIANMLRLYALVQIKLFYPTAFPFFHEYLFPGMLYLMAFGIMVYWVKRTYRP